MKCRGKKLREKIVKEYDVVPILHTILLNGQKKHSDAEAIIENEYYIFNLHNHDWLFIGKLSCIYRDLLRILLFLCICHDLLIIIKQINITE